MEDYVIREIDRIGELLLKVARKLGLLDGGMQEYSLADALAYLDGKGYYSFRLHSLSSQFVR